MAKRNPAQIELCFDSMTDLITNLAGGLVLVALLLLGMTQEVKHVHQASEFATAKKKQEGGSKSLSPLERQSEILRAELVAMEKNIASLEAKLPKLQQDVDTLLDRAKSGGSKK